MASSKFWLAGYALIAMVPIFIISGIWISLTAASSGDYKGAAMGIICIIFFGFALVFSFSRSYIPGKSFAWVRGDINSMKKRYNLGIASLLAIIVVFSFLDPRSTIRNVLLGSWGIYTFYGMRKSLKVHADVDYAANQTMAITLGIPINEKALLSYQNFDSVNPKPGSNLFIVTALRLVAATYDGRQWQKMTRNLDQIRRIGFLGSDNGTGFSVRLVFDDNSAALLRMNVFDKLTSSPHMIAKKFLDILDHSLERSPSVEGRLKRRRVSVDQPPPPQPEEHPAQALLSEAKEARVLEISSNVPASLASAIEIPSGRTLEL